MMGFVWRAALVAAMLGATAAHERAPRPVPSSMGSSAMSGGIVTVAPEILFHTLSSDFFVQPDGTIYVQTGDIPAMWLRDAAAQTLPYVRISRSRPALRTWIRAVIAREAKNIDVDPYANAFRADYTVWERKWEVDSLAYPVVLAWSYEDTDGDPRIFTPTLHRALERIVATYACERRHDHCSRYRFNERGENADRGAVAENGLIWSAFRASDDPSRFGYNIPEQMLAVTALRDLADLATRGFGDRRLSAEARSMASGIDAAIARYGVVYDFHCGGAIYAFEVDGLGDRIVVDDANIPSLLAAPLSGFASVDDPLYQRTRRCMLSSVNPYYYSGAFASGIGSPHTPKGYVWPLALIARALTSTDRNEVVRQMRELAATAGRDGLIHESFDPDRPERFTRAEFGWANAMYAELLFRAAAGFPAERVTAEPPVFFARTVADSIAVVDPGTALDNRGSLLRSFERSVPIPLVGSDGD